MLLCPACVSRGRSWGITVLALVGLAAGTSASPAVGAGCDGTSGSAGAACRVPGPRLHDDLLRRLLFGRRYRDLWTTPVHVEVLDFGSFAGGLTPEGRTTTGRERTLVLRAADGHAYRFRPLQPGGESSFNGEPHVSLASRLLPDRGSSTHPAGPLVAAALLDAAGVLHPRPRLVALPADSALSGLRGEFVGQLGILEESTDPGEGGFGDAPAGSRIADTPGLLDSLAGGPANQVDSREFLRARLVDFILGGADAEPASWRWIRCAGDRTGDWRVISAVDDRSFTREGGLLNDFASLRQAYQPQRRSGDEPGPRTRHGIGCAGLDRRLLAGLDRPAWDAVVADVETRLNDAAIDSAVNAMPAEMRRLNARDLAARLRRQRDALPDFAARYYSRVNEAADLYTTRTDELVTLDRPDDGHCVVRFFALAASGRPEPRPYFQRRFDAGETGEIRIYLRGGHDRVVVRGPGRDSITLRIVGSGRGDVLEDSSAAGGVCYYDTEEQTRVASLNDVELDRRPYAALRAEGESAENAGEPAPASPDYGRTSSLSRWVSPGTRAGFFLGGELNSETYGFRQPRYASRTSLRAGYSLALHGYVAEASREIRRPNSGLSGTLLLRASTMDVSSFYGLGNETPDTTRHALGRNRVVQINYLVRPSVTYDLSRRASISFGAPFKVVRTDASSSGEIIRALRPYGSGSYSQLGGQIGFTYGGGISAGRGDRSERSDPGARGDHGDHGDRSDFRGARLDLLGSCYPKTFGLASRYGSVEGRASLALGPASHPGSRIVFRTGAKKLFGRYPFAEAATLGGRDAELGLGEQRFAGDASIYGSTELSQGVFRIRRLVPGQFGVLALAGTGRVFVSGERSRTWHSVLGPGVWFSPGTGRARVSLTYLRGERRPGFSLGGVLGF